MKTIVSSQILKNAEATPSQLTRLIPTSATSPDYSQYRFRAELTWIEVEVRMQGRAFSWTVVDLTGDVYVEALDISCDGSATRYCIRVNNPTCWQEVENHLQRLTVDHPLIDSPVVTAIHVSFAAYSRSNSPEQSMQMAAHLCKFTTHLCGENRRRTVRLRCRAASVGVCLNNKPKIDDECDPPPVSDFRAGIERTYRMSLFGAKGLAVWKRHNFALEAHHFKFRKLKASLPKDVQADAEKADQLGEPVNLKRRGGGGVKKYRDSTVADSKLNRRAYDALRDLTTRMRNPAL